MHSSVADPDQHLCSGQDFYDGIYSVPIYLQTEDVSVRRKPAQIVLYPLSMHLVACIVSYTKYMLVNTHLLVFHLACLLNW